MGLRIKLFLPTLLGLLAFSIFIHFFWATEHETEQFNLFIETQTDFLKTIEPEISRSLISNDLATLNAFLDEQMRIHKRNWRSITLQQENGDRIYPLFGFEKPESQSIIELSHIIYEGSEDVLGEISLYLDWSNERKIITQHTQKIEIVLLGVLAFIALTGALLQSKIVLSPLIRLRHAVSQFEEGNYNVKLKTRRTDEIGDLLRHFDSMRAQRQINEESLRIAATAFEIHEGIIITDDKGCIIRVNHAFSRITGYSEEEVIGKNPRILQSEKQDQQFYKKLWNEIQNNGQWIGEIWNKRKNGEIYPQYSAITAVKNKNGKTTHYVGSFLDITTTKKQQTELELARDKAEIASRAKSDFLATMSHEIRTPMNGVLGMAQLLSDTDLNKEQKNYLDTIKFSGQNLLTIINDILDFSKIEAKKMELDPVPFDLLNSSFEVTRLLNSKAREKGLELLFNIAPVCPHYVIGDPGRLRQILLNILGNAIKFTEQGHILLDIRCTNKSDLSADLSFSVTDTGIGISKEQQQQLFKPFTQADSSTTRKFGGTGLGLSICHQLVKLMGSEIKVESSPGTGSMFSFTLTMPLTDIPEPLPMHDLSGLKVLLVDDNSTNLKILQEQTKAAGIEAYCASNAAEALELLHGNDNQPVMFDTAILDYCMPSMDGAELGKIILSHTKTKELPLILLTSAGQRGDIKIFDELGFSGYLTKPALSKTLLGMISAVTALQPGNKKHILTSHSIFDATTAENDTEFSTLQISNAKVLLAEDDLINQQVATGILNKLNIEPDVAANGREAVEMAKTTHYDLILMDCLMPEMDGFEATRELRKDNRTHKTPIIALTANAQKSDRERCIESGMDDFLAKPFEFEDLIRLLNCWLPENTLSNETTSELQAVSQSPQADHSLTPLVNFEVFDRLKNTIPDSFDDILKAFIDDTDQKINQMPLLITEKSFGELCMMAHSLKSSSATLGALTLSKVSALLESSAKQQDTEAAVTLAAELKATYQNTRESLLNH